MLNHLGGVDANKLARILTVWNIRLLMAKGLFWVSASVGVLVWAIKT